MNVCLLIDGSFLEVTASYSGLSISRVFCGTRAQEEVLAKLEADNSFGPNTGYEENFMGTGEKRR